MKKSVKRTNSNRGSVGQSAGGQSSIGLCSVAFATVARELSVEARQWGHDAPSFRSPPRIAGLRRSISRREDGSVTIAVTTRNRSIIAVISDMIEGVIASASVPEAEAGAFRDALWVSVESQLLDLLTPAKAPKDGSEASISTLRQAS